MLVNPHQNVYASLFEEIVPDIYIEVYVPNVMYCNNLHISTHVGDWEEVKHELGSP
jgi:hypothetical protein